MKFLHKLSFLLCVGVTASLLACQEPYHQKEEQFYLIAANINLPYWQEAQAGMLDAAKAMGVKAELDGPATLSPQEEVESFRRPSRCIPRALWFPSAGRICSKVQSMPRCSREHPLSPSILTRQNLAACCLWVPIISAPVRKAAGAWPLSLKDKANWRWSPFQGSPTSNSGFAV